MRMISSIFDCLRYNEYKGYVMFNFKKVSKIFNKSDKSVGVALGGGAVWAASHIGVLEVLEKNKIKISAISGTSAGSVVASLYAFGFSVEDIKKIALNLRLLDIFHWKASKMGLSTTNKIKKLIKTYIGDSKVEDARIPLYIPATDVLEGKPYLMEDIPVYEAVAASCAIPGIYAPLTIKGKIFVDGSLFADVPCKILKIKHIKTVIGVELSDKKNLKKNPTNLFDVIMKSFQCVVNETRLERMKYADFIISPNVDDIGRFDLDKINLLIERGSQATIEQISRITKYLNNQM